MATLRSATLEYHSSNAYRVVSWPNGAQAGDLAVVAIGNRYLPSLPEGWTTVDVLSGQNQSGRLAWKILTGADIGGGTYTYVLAGQGTGSVATFCFVAGTFNAASPMGNYVTSIASDINEFMPYVAVNTGQTLYHFATARTTAIGIAISSDGVLLDRGDAAVDVEASIYADTATSETTRHTTWTGTAASTGAYKVSFAVNFPSGSVRFPGLDNGVAYAMVTAYSAVAYAPANGSMQDINSPSLTAMVDGSPSPFQVQYQVSPKADFSIIAWSTTRTNVTKGLITSQVGVALNNQQNYYWHARTGDGTVWGPWSVAKTFVIQLGVTAAAEYLLVNVGGSLDQKDPGGEYLYDNVGLSQTPADIGIDEIYENVGFMNTPDDRVAEYTYESVDNSIPTPHLWFAYKAYGFAEDHVFLYGQGLGTLQDQYGAVIKMDYGPRYDYTDLTPAVFDWGVNPAGPHAYDTQRHIFAGGDNAPPVMDVEVDVVEIVVPSAATPDTAQTDYFYAVTDAGASNRLPWLMYPIIPMPMETAPSQNSSGGAVRIGGAPVGPPHEIATDYSAYTLEPYLLAGGRLERLPLLSAVTRSAFQLTVSDPTENLEDPVTAKVPALVRWRPLSGDVTPRTDLGTGVSLWVPTVKSSWGAGLSWKVYSDTAPYVDDQHTIPSRMGEIPRPAMIFPGKSFAQLDGSLQAGPNFSLTMVVQFYGRSAQRQVLLSSNGPLPAGTNQFELALTGDLLSLNLGTATTAAINRMNGRTAQFRIPASHFGQRPIIFGMSVSPDKVGTVQVISSVAHATKFFTATFQSQPGLFLGRAADGDPATMATMDILDLTIDASVTSSALWRLTNALDSIYGVTNT